MSSITRHADSSLKRTGKDYRDLHEWLDGKDIHYKERLARHDINKIRFK